MEEWIDILLEYQSVAIQFLYEFCFDNNLDDVSLIELIFSTVFPVVYSTRKLFSLMAKKFLT